MYYKNSLNHKFYQRHGDFMVKRIKNTISVRLSEFLRKTQTDTDRRFRLEINSLGILSLCGIKEVNSFDDENILVSCSDIITEIKGENMLICSFSDTEIAVSGKISTINFIRR